MIYVTGCRGAATSQALRGISFSGDDYLFMVGGLNTWWQPKEWHDWYASLEAYPCTKLFIDCNHENFDLLKDLPTEKKFGDYVGVFGTRFYYLQRGRIYLVNDKKILAFGGAQSVFQRYRKDTKLWWPEEVPSKLEFELAKINLAKADYKVDIILSHAIPAQIFHKFRDGVAGPVCMQLAFFYSRVIFDHWFCSTMNSDFKCQRVQSVYKKVVSVA